MKTLFALGVAALAVFMTGCANLNSQSRNFEGFSTKILTTDASQRAFISVNRKGNEPHTFTPVFCAEPSPDALIAYATSVGASVNVPGKAALDLALAQQQTAASIGLRTQTIQLLRDGMFRLCEAYASGAIEEGDMDQLQRRYQNMMMGLLAVEQLTGPVVARQVALSSAVGAAVGKSIADVVGQLGDVASKQAQAATDADAAKARVIAKKDEIKTLNAASPKDQTSIDKADKELAVLVEDQTKANTALNAAKAQYTSVENTLKDAQKLVANATGAVVLADAVSGGKSPADTDYSTAAKTVKEIVFRVLAQNHLTDQCKIFAPNASGKKIDPKKVDETKALASLCVEKIFSWYSSDELAYNSGEKPADTNVASPAGAAGNATAATPPSSSPPPVATAKPPQPEKPAQPLAQAPGAGQASVGAPATTAKSAVEKAKIDTARDAMRESLFRSIERRALLPN